MTTAPADEVLALLQEAGERFVRPRFRALADADMAEKSPGDWVTIADREAEVFLESALRAVRPDLPVVGEEAVAGGVSRRLDGTAYRADATGLGTLAATTPEAWELARSTWPFD